MNEKEQKIISSFTGEYRFLSNFYPSSFTYKNLLYPTNEHFYQSFKTLNLEDRERIRLLKSPGLAKKEGAKLIKRPDWEEVKNKIMWIGLKNKFNQNPDLAIKLQNTGDAILQEGNFWKDFYWGVCLKTNTGENVLGKMLMEIRKTL